MAFSLERFPTAPLSQSLVLLLVALRQAGVSSVGYSGHSFRTGVATAATQAGTEDSTIQELGRWNILKLVKLGSKIVW